MTDILAIANQKGGVGKTTTAVNLAACLAYKNKKTLLVDLDPQGNATMGCGLQKSELELTITDVLLEECNISDAIVSSECGVDVLGANRELSGIDLTLVNNPNREYVLRNALAQVQDHYDYIVIDCAPSLNLLTVNGLCATHGIIIPMQCEYYALEGLADLVETIQGIKKFNARLNVRGVLRTLFDARNTLSKDVSDELEYHFGDKLFKTIISKNVRLAEAPSHGKPILYYDKIDAKGSQQYLSLAEEIINK